LLKKGKRREEAKYERGKAHGWRCREKQKDMRENRSE
jgi:hypothetical protein